MKKLASLLLALALCMGLTVPALATAIASPFEEDQLPAYFLDNQEGSGPNWSYSYTPEGVAYLKLDGVNRWAISLDRPTIIHLAPGSKNVIDLIEYHYDSMYGSKGPHTITFSGTGS